jgi:excisionase family DNA binding protein
MKSRPTLPPLDSAQRYSIDEAIAYLRSSRKTIYDDISEGRLATIKEGKRRFVPGSEIARRSRAVTAAA